MQKKVLQNVGYGDIIKDAKRNRIFELKNVYVFLYLLGKNTDALFFTCTFLSL